MSQKSYDGKPTLYLIPTPIGNMGDITKRGEELLNYVDVVFSEDTRVTMNLLRSLNVNKPLVSSHEHNEENTKYKVIKYLEDGKNVGLVSDRGTPGISDPGFVVAKYVIERGYNVVGLPGATAFVPALIVSGLESDHFLFYGFLDSKHSKRIKELESLKRIPYTIIFYEAPHRIFDMLNDLYEVFGERKVSISREISKKHEEIYWGTTDKIRKEDNLDRGELVIVVDGFIGNNNFDNLTIIEHVNMYIKEGLSQKDAMKKVAVDRGITKAEVYKVYHNL